VHGKNTFDFFLAVISLPADNKQGCMFVGKSLQTRKAIQIMEEL
jgi:hypothetical protein